MAKPTAPTHRKGAFWEPYRTEEQRGYRLGERNPATLPDGSHERETEYMNEQSTRFWRKARAWAVQPGGKYV